MNDWIDAEQHVERAHELYEARRWKEAESELRRALTLNPYKAEWHFNLGLTLEAAGRVEEAARSYQTSLGLDDSNAQAHLALGVAMLRLDRPKDAVGPLESARRLEQSWPDPALHLIEAHARSGDHDAAEMFFYLALQFEGVDEASARVNLADSLLARGRHEQAITTLREVSAIDSDMPGVYARLAEAHSELGRLDRARQLYLRELRTHPGDVETLLDLGALLLDMNRLTEAGEKFRRVLELESNHADAHYYLAELATRRGHVAEAAELYRLVLRLDPSHPLARRRLAELLLDMGDADCAQRALERELRMQGAESADSLPPEEPMDLCRLLIRAGMADRAEPLLIKATTEQPENAEAHHLLSVARLRMGRIEEGVASAERALSLDHTLVAAASNIALANVRMRRWKAAGAWARRGLRLEPDDPVLLRIVRNVRRHAVRMRLRRRLRRIFVRFSAAQRAG